jgi:hypothetical protein
MITERANIIRQNRKSIKILITEDGQINIYAPKHVTNSDIEKLVGNKESWAVKKAEKQKIKAQTQKDRLAHKEKVKAHRQEIKHKRQERIYFSSSSCAPEAIASSVRVLKAIHQLKIGGDDREKHQLCYLLTCLEKILLVGVIVELDHDASCVPTIDDPFSRESVLDIESRLALDEAHIPLRNLHMDSRVDDGRADLCELIPNIGRASGDFYIHGCVKVESCIGFVRSCGHIGPFI